MNDMSQLFSIKFSKFVPIDSIIDNLKKRDIVQYAHRPMVVWAFTDPPDDEYYDSTNQWNLYTIDAEGAWDFTTGSSSVEVGIVDPGYFNPSHPDLSGKFNETGNYDTTGTEPYHGNQVSGIIGAATDNDLGIASLGWNVKMKPFAFDDYDWPDNPATKLSHARTDGADVINCSWGSKTHYPEILEEIENCFQDSIVVVAATGNKDEKDVPFYPYPANYRDYVIGVAATDSDDEHPDGYNYVGDTMDQFIDVAAPGYDVMTTYSLDTNYQNARGTSFACPHVSALAALLISYDSSLGPVSINNLIKDNTDYVGDEEYFGTGRINAYETLKASKPPPSAPTSLTITNAGQVGFNPNLSWNSSTGATSYKVYRTGSPVNWEVIATRTTTSYTDTDVFISSEENADDLFYYRVNALNLHGESENSNIVSTWGETFQKPIFDQFDTSTDIPKEFALRQNYPNPLNPTTSIEFDLPEETYVCLSIFDIRGREIRTLVDESRYAGFHTVVWDGKDNYGLYASSGVYFYILQAGDKKFTKKLTFLK